VINEVMAENTMTLEDPRRPGKFPDWLELYNGSAGEIPLGGMFLTDDPLVLTKWQIPDGLSISSHGYLVFLADGGAVAEPNRLSFKIDLNGEYLLLVDVDGQTVIDAVLFDEQRRDVSYGRSPDGGDAWGFLAQPTPGAGNAAIVP
jgi:lamin tail-like protein